MADVLRQGVWTHKGEEPYTYSLDKTSGGVRYISIDVGEKEKEGFWSHTGSFNRELRNLASEYDLSVWGVQGFKYLIIVANMAVLGHEDIADILVAEADEDWDAALEEVDTVLDMRHSPLVVFTKHLFKSGVDSLRAHCFAEGAWREALNQVIDWMVGACSGYVSSAFSDSRVNDAALPFHVEHRNAWGDTYSDIVIDDIDAFFEGDFDEGHYTHYSDCKYNASAVQSLVNDVALMGLACVTHNRVSWVSVFADDYSSDGLDMASVLADKCGIMKGVATDCVLDAYTELDDENGVVVLTREDTTQKVAALCNYFRSWTDAVEFVLFEIRSFLLD